MDKHYPAFNRHSQHGAVLIISLLILLILTIMGVSSMRSSALEEKMASNSRDRNVGFQSAETAMRAAEVYIESLATTGNFNDTNGLYSSIGNEPDPYDPNTWSTAGAFRSATAPGGSNAAKYYISRAGTIKENDTLEIPPSVINDITIFRIVARGEGATPGSSEVILRSYYGRKM